MATGRLDIAGMTLGSSLGAGLTDQSGGGATWSVVADADGDGGNAVQVDDVTGSVNEYATVDALSATADVEILALTRNYVDDPGALHGGILYYRVHGSPDEAYALRAEDDLNGYRLYYFTGGSEFSGSINFGGGGLFTAGNVLALRARVIGTTHEYKVWEPADAADPTADEPGSWEVTETDANISDAGLIGFGGRQSEQGNRLLYLSWTDSPSTESAPAPAVNVTATNTMSVRDGSSWVDKVVKPRVSGSWS